MSRYSTSTRPALGVLYVALYALRPTRTMGSADGSSRSSFGVRAIEARSSKAHALVHMPAPLK